MQDATVRARKAMVTLVLLFLAIGLLEVRIPFIGPPVSTDLTTSFTVFLLWAIRAAVVPIIFAVDRLMARRLWLGIAVDAVALIAFAPLGSLVSAMFATVRRSFPLLALTPLGAPLFDIVFIAVVATAAVIRHRDSALQESVAQERLDNELARCALQAMHAEVHGDTILASLDTIESLIERDGAQAERAITITSDFLQMVMRRADRDRVSLGLELRFAALSVQLAALIAGKRIDCSIDDVIPEADCEPGALRSLIDRATAAVVTADTIRFRAAESEDGIIATTAVERGGATSPLHEMRLMAPADAW